MLIDLCGHDVGVAAMGPGYASLSHVFQMSTCIPIFFFFSSRRRHTRSDRDWSSDVCSSDLLPDYVIFGQPVTLTFTVRQHGVTRLSGLKPSIEARSGDVTTTASASPGRETGQIGRASCRERV